jgi:hypothetical protein
MLLNLKLLQQLATVAPSEVRQAQLAERRALGSDPLV